MNNNTIKYFAKFVVETATPIAVGSGEKGLTVDRLIAKDANGLPYIPGTSLAGVIRHEIENSKAHTDKEINRVFGYEDKNNGQGSRISFSPAKLIADDSTTVLEGLHNIDFTEGYYSFFQKLPERDHVRITHKGSADTANHGKFDEELVHKGTRFAFEVELMGTDVDTAIWENILQIIHAPFFRVGAGTRKGFGQLEIKSCHHKRFDLTQSDDLIAYLDKSSSLNYDCSHWDNFDSKEGNGDRWKHYHIQLEPENFFLFGAGFGDEDVDMKPKTERYFDWSSGKPVLGEKQEHLLIPATSVKGALSHRVAFHYNRLQKVSLSNLKTTPKVPTFDPSKAIVSFNFGVAIDELAINSKSDQWEKLKAQIENTSIEDFYTKSISWSNFKEASETAVQDGDEASMPVGESNDAVKALFGYAKSDEDGARGKVILSDIYLSKSECKEKVFSHVAIDRFTGGGIDGALYQEKAVNSAAFKLDIYVERAALTEDNIKAAFEEALNDLVNGRLQLGGNTSKGHGAFKGTFN